MAVALRGLTIGHLTLGLLEPNENVRFFSMEIQSK